ncbi:Hypothetical predicted protein [Mytilus galloprovincialis]|uniref:Uncharacterized protein n=1 Tax=Mytilus galloprovincialis TaxID=29158 RepID=A0A8B6CX79_MYTGA|nr:Hypothetical predicted protein [Mytilus galloprovincialis]
MFSNEKKTAKPGKTPDNYKQQVHYKLDSAFEGLDIFADQQDDIISFKKGYPIEHQVADCDNDTTIPYGDDQPFSQSSPIKSNPSVSSWTGPPTLPSSITPFDQLSQQLSLLLKQVPQRQLRQQQRSGAGPGTGQTTSPSINTSVTNFSHSFYNNTNASTVTATTSTIRSSTTVPVTTAARTGAGVTSAVSTTLTVNDLFVTIRIHICALILTIEKSES